MSAAILRFPRLFTSLVRFEHTIFVLPFAYVGAFLSGGVVPSAHGLVWVTVAMVGARSLAMALNRLIDAGLDARNPRTASRELPSGLLRAWQVAVFAALSLGLFLAAVYQLAPLVRWLWPIPVVAFVVYPYLKRFTWLCHAWLGMATGLAPVAAWVALTNELPWQAWLLTAAVALWIFGFDVLYALFDVEVDRAQGLHSVPARFGIPAAFSASRLAHVGAVACLVVVGLGLPVGVLYWAGVGVVALLLAQEHVLVRPADLRRLNAAFFTMNGAVALLFFVFVLGDVLR